MSAFKRAIASVGGISGACGGAVSVISLALSFRWPDANAPWVLAILGALVFVASVIVANFQLHKRLIPQIEIKCGKTVPNSFLRDHTLRLDHLDLDGRRLLSTAVVIDLFGFTLTNKGTTPIENCEALLVRISDKNGVLSEKLSRLPAEPRNQGKDLEVFTLWHNKAQPVTLCSVTGDNRVMIGTGNMLWRHLGTDEAFDEIGEYYLDVQISGVVDGVGMETIERQFTFCFGGDRASSHLLSSIAKVKK